MKKMNDSKTENQEYFPIYKEIENEVINLAYSIRFCDEQLEVYSVKIADLIMRCAVEIESLFKDIYRREAEREPQKTNECVMFANKKWNIEEKEVTIVNPLFNVESLKTFAPFSYKNNSPEDYYSAYNAIKHDRMANLSKANVNTLIRILGALFLMELYYKNKRYVLENDYYARDMDRTSGSNVFVFKVAPFEDVVALDSDNEPRRKCVYAIRRNESEYAYQIQYLNYINEVKTSRLVITEQKWQQTLAEHVGEEIPKKDYEEFFLREFKYDMHYLMKRFKMKEILSISVIKMRDYYTAELNID